VILLRSNVSAFAGHCVLLNVFILGFNFRFGRNVAAKEDSLIFSKISKNHTIATSIFSTIKVKKIFIDEGLPDRSGNPFFVRPLISSG